MCSAAAIWAGLGHAWGPDLARPRCTKINAKHIIFSYNNTGNSMDGRSNAKISFNQIKNILIKKGKTEINQIKFKAFTTGKSKAENHKEILFYCRVK